MKIALIIFIFRGHVEHIVRASPNVKNKRNVSYFTRNIILPKLSYIIEIIRYWKTIIWKYVRRTFVHFWYNPLPHNIIFIYLSIHLWYNILLIFRGLPPSLTHSRTCPVLLFNIIIMFACLWYFLIYIFNIVFFSRKLKIQN